MGRGHQELQGTPEEEDGEVKQRERTSASVRDRRGHVDGELALYSDV